MTDKNQDNQEQDKMINREGCEIADAMFEITQQCCDREDWYPAMCHCAEVNGTHPIFADIMFKITQLCETSEDCRRAMRHCIEMCYSYNYLAFDTNDVRALLRYEGNLSSFEVSVNENQENRVLYLVEQMKEHIKSYGNINAVLINFYKSKELKIKMDEFSALQILMDTTGLDCDIHWGLSRYKRCTDPILRATVLVMYEPQRVKSNKNNQLKERKESWTKKMYRKLLAAIPWKGIRCLRRLQGILLQTVM